MDTKMQNALRTIDERADELAGLSDRIWEYAELSLQEEKSAGLYCDFLEKEGFTVTRGVAGLATAFTASYGHGKPVIGLLAEYDALSGMSQQGGETQRKPVVPGGNGHGCGHNLLGAGSLAAALAVKAFLEEQNGEGTVIMYGCPGEEGGSGKAFMAREHIFTGLDAAFCWHPFDTNFVMTTAFSSSMQLEFSFTGRSAHAAQSPHLGRSALDAVELMNVGVQYLREHMPPGDRVHYAISDTGGLSPNVVQAEAKVLYMVRSQNVRSAQRLMERVRHIAEGAARMTDTSFTERFIDGSSDVVLNLTLCDLLARQFEQLGVPSYTDEEREYAEKLYATYKSEVPGPPYMGVPGDEEARREVARLSDNGEKPLNDFTVPYQRAAEPLAASTDVGDVSWQTPTAQVGVVCHPSKAPQHSWQVVSCGRSSIGHKGLLHAGRVLAGAAIDLYGQPEVLAAARQEFAERTQEGYICPIPKDAVPAIVE